MSMDFVMAKKQRGEEIIAKAGWLADPSSSMRHVIPMAIATLGTSCQCTDRDFSNRHDLFMRNDTE